MSLMLSGNNRYSPTRRRRGHPYAWGAIGGLALGIALMVFSHTTNLLALVPSVIAGVLLTWMVRYDGSRDSDNSDGGSGNSDSGNSNGGPRYGGEIRHGAFRLRPPDNE